MLKFVIPTSVLAGLILLLSCCRQVKNSPEENDITRNAIISKNNLMYATELELNAENVRCHDLILNTTDSNAIKQLLRTGPKLFFNFSEMNCETCVDEQIRLLKKYTEVIGSENIIFLGSYSEQRKFEIFLKSRHLHFPAYSISEHAKNNTLRIANANLPYYFIADHTLRVHNAFLPIREEPQLTETFLKSVPGFLTN